MFSAEDLSALLISVDYSCTAISNGRTKVYIQELPNRHTKLILRGLLNVEISDNGEVYNPICLPCHLGVLFDWLNRVGYCKERVLGRTSVFKEELMGRCFQVFRESL